jgi:hypothetical protein
MVSMRGAMAKLHKKLPVAFSRQAALSVTSKAMRYMQS